MDLFLEIHEASVMCQLKQEDCLLCLKFGEKIPLNSMTRVPGAGNASNVAIAARRLGWNSAIVCVLGSDGTGHEIVHRWKEEKVDTRYVTHDPKHPTNIHSVIQFKDERTILVYHEPRPYVLPAIKSTRWVYYSSLAKGHEKMEKELLAWLEQHPETRLGFNPGTFQLRRGIKSLAPILERCEFLCVNKQEAQFLLKTKEHDERLLLNGLKRYGPKIVAITDGERGSFVSDGIEQFFCPAFPGKAKERTGAGDSFAMGFIHSYTASASLTEALRYGTATSWNVIRYVGPHAGLPIEQELAKILTKFKKIQPRAL